jgi:Na+-driven multidrug efflux pump
MGAEADVVPLGTGYMRIIAAGGPFMVVAMSLTAAYKRDVWVLTE